MGQRWVACHVINLGVAIELQATFALDETVSAVLGQPRPLMCLARTMRQPRQSEASKCYINYVFIHVALVDGGVRPSTASPQSSSDARVESFARRHHLSFSIRTTHKDNANTMGSTRNSQVDEKSTTRMPTLPLWWATLGRRRTDGGHRL
ncbi:hypothetical protein CBL_05563 [Carabus blaptoides fortunei]